MIGDPTLYVMNKMQEVLKELNVTVERYDLYEIKNNITHHKSLKDIELLFEELGISDKIHSRIDRMSFGQQQRVAFIRSLCQPHDFILLDEPISHLDDHNSDVMRDILLREVRSSGASIIATSIGKHMNIDYDVCLNL